MPAVRGGAWLGRVGMATMITTTKKKAKTRNDGRIRDQHNPIDVQRHVIRTGNLVAQTDLRPHSARSVIDADETDPMGILSKCPTMILERECSRVKA